MRLLLRSIGKEWALVLLLQHCAVTTAATIWLLLQLLTIVITAVITATVAAAGTIITAAVTAAVRSTDRIYSVFRLDSGTKNITGNMPTAATGTPGCRYCNFFMESKQ